MGKDHGYREWLTLPAFAIRPLVVMTKFVLFGLTFFVDCEVFYHPSCRSFATADRAP